jgi:hypothetical protein
MTENDGVIQYHLNHRDGELPAEADYPGLYDWFRRCRERELIGRDPERYQGYAFGNISVRAAPGFVISGTQTGGKATLGTSDLAWVIEFDTVANRLRSIGPCRPSSEAMTHGEVYRRLPGVNAVIHAHSPTVWQAAGLLGLPTTSPGAGYGTPQMAHEVAALLAAQPESGVLVMGGHEDGIIAYGGDMQVAGRQLLQTLAEAELLPARS